ncbi:hypothetical protein, partial [Bradyrhizobium brasilense]|uniref:hypothetical protein n=1 Tax=Bradyrhizobium brasilense TaxID=1419277 RepID=UPI001AEF0576
REQSDLLFSREGYDASRISLRSIRATKLSIRHPEEREARLEGSTAPLVAVHPSRRASRSSG